MTGANSHALEVAVVALLTLAVLGAAEWMLGYEWLPLHVIGTLLRTIGG